MRKNSWRTIIIWLIVIGMVLSLAIGLVSVVFAS